MVPDAAAVMVASTFGVAADSADGAVGSNDDFESPHAAVITATATTIVNNISRALMTISWRPGYRHAVELYCKRCSAF